MGAALRHPQVMQMGAEMPAAPLSLLHSDSKFDLAEVEPGVLQWLSFSGRCPRPF